ncbi:MAG: Stp1/IreP family PP2C-type Ser/Thr phosphatase [Coriobacteriia bacterium]|nr:Stp1/IreP family PP2C-type Ser/Thr phosphatase [Coriobacteriia bacterium]
MSASHHTPAAGLTDTGLTRASNEDALLIEPPLYAVADGMGGHRAGEIASRVALEELLASAPARLDAKALGRAVRAANRAVIAAATKSRGRTGMGTTLTAAMVDGASLAIAHVGDSRAYLLHEGCLERLTDDHSMVGELIREGTLTEEEARFHPQRSVITRALGSDANMVADVFEVEGYPGDRLLLTTDGLTAMLADEFIGEILMAEKEPERAAQTLVDAANRAGGYDNITVVVVDLTGTPAQAYSPRRGSTASGRRIASRLLWVVAAIALAAAAMYGAWSYARSRAYLIDEGGVVTVYRGVPGSFGGVSLHWRVRSTSVQVDRLELPLATRLRTGIPFEDVASALERADQLQASVAPTSSPDATATPMP